MQMHPSQQHQDFHKDALDLLRKHTGHLPAIHMLAVASQMLGQIMAHQDQRNLTVEQAWEIIGKNIEAGNQMAVDQLANANASDVPS